MRIRRSCAGIRFLAIPNTNSVGCWHITEPQFGWTECHGAHEATDPLDGFAWLRTRAFEIRGPPWGSAGQADRRPVGAGGSRGIRRRDETTRPGDPRPRWVADLRSSGRQRTVAVRRLPSLIAWRQLAPGAAVGD